MEQIQFPKYSFSLEHQPMDKLDKPKSFTVVHSSDILQLILFCEG